MIPKVIYMCHKTLEHIRIYSNNWKKLNPEYEIKLYDNDLCQQFFLEEYSQLHCNIFNFIPDGPIKADFWRICVINKYGGLYVDADIEPLVPLKNYIDDDDDFVTCISDVLDLKISNPGPDDIILNPHFILSNKNNDILEKAINRYIYYYRNKVTYSYWKWSIVKLLQLGFKITKKKSQVMYVNKKKFKFLLELPSRNDCEYNGKIVLHNRYLTYSGHQFVDTTNVLPKKMINPNVVQKKILKQNEVSLIPNKTAHIKNKSIISQSESNKQIISPTPKFHQTETETKTQNSHHPFLQESPLQKYKVQMNQNIIPQPKRNPTFNVENSKADEKILLQGIFKNNFNEYTNTKKPNYFNSRIQNIIPKPDPTQTKTSSVSSNLVLHVPTKSISKARNNLTIIYL